MNMEDQLKHARLNYNKWTPATYRLPATSKAAEIEHHKMHDEIERQTQEFLARGGTIEKVEGTSI